MSLRQLKFKPKIQLNTAAKNKSDDNNSKPSVKVVCNNKNDVSSDPNPIDNKALLVEENKGEKKNSEELSELKDKSPALFKDSEVSNICKPVETTISIVCDIDNKSISKNDDIPLVLNNDLHGNGSKPTSGSSDLLVDNTNGSSSYLSSSPQPQQKSIEGSEIQSNSNPEDNVNSTILGDSNKKAKSLINHGVLNKLSSLSCQQVTLQNHDPKNVVDKESQDGLLNEVSKSTKTTLNDTTEKNDNIRAEKDRSFESEVVDICPVKVSKVLNKENFESLKNNKLSTSAKGNNGSKPTKRKKHEGKNTDATPSKATAHQRANFKPNVAALGKIRRPEKFATSSYSKMGSLAKEQFFKKFGKQQEPDASKLTMMDLIFYNPSSNPMPQSSDKKLLSTLNNSVTAEKVEEINGSDLSHDKDRNEDHGEETDDNADDLLPVPQLKISADGKVIVAQESLVIKPSNNLDNFNFETVIDSEIKKRKPVKNPNRCGWSHIDTIKFYKALNSLGCDFETMQSIFPDRSRRNLKSKFKKEEKLHGSLINKVLSRHSEFDLANVVRELEIDEVYKDTIKTYGRAFTETEKRSKGRKKTLSSLVAGKSSKKKDGGESDDSISDEEFDKKKKKIDLEVLSKMSKVLGLNEENNSSPEIETLPSGESSDVCDSKDIEKTKRKRRKLIEYTEESDSDFEREIDASVIKNITEDKNIGNLSSRRTSRVMSNRKKVKPPPERIQSKRVVLRLEELIDFNDGSIKEPQPESQTEVINDNHIIINTNIEFENVKYTRYISYNSNNLENPIEINETVAHVD